MGWTVEPDRETKPGYMRAYENVFIGEDVAKHYLNIPAKTNEYISFVVNNIKNQDLKDKVADTLNQIKLMFPSAVITSISVSDICTFCVIIYDFITEATAIDTITDLH